MTTNIITKIGLTFGIIVMVASILLYNYFDISNVVSFLILLLGAIILILSLTFDKEKTDEIKNE